MYFLSSTFSLSVYVVTSSLYTIITLFGRYLVFTIQVLLTTVTGYYANGYYLFQMPTDSRRFFLNFFRTMLNILLNFSASFCFYSTSASSDSNTISSINSWIWMSHHEVYKQNHTGKYKCKMIVRCMLTGELDARFFLH